VWYGTVLEEVRHTPSAGGGGRLLIRDHDARRGVDVLHGKMKVAPSWFCDLICFPGRMFEFHHIVNL
jgi:hypothetical protein